ncbi:MAG: SDR family oxidoreductase [Acidobacteria bacterium]|nr:MAG: SDR family oxidoreductase [Acidobacteriota bacterium]
MAEDLRGKVAIITGASSGIGKETALALAGEGVRVVLAARREPRLREVAEMIDARGGQALIVPTDMSVPHEVERLIRMVVERFQRIDLLINNAGYGLFASIEETTTDDLRRIMEVNFIGAFVAIKAVLPVMRQQGRGHIINVASVAGKRALPYSGAYSATKFALVALSESLRVELAGSGIDVSLVCPAATATEFFQVAENRTGRRVRPVGPVQSAGEVARAIVGLARRPRPEVITFKPARALVVLNAVSPRMIDWAMRQSIKRARQRREESTAAGAGPGV